jgi:hypothetical protein
VSELQSDVTEVVHPPREPIVIERFDFRAFHGRPACCHLEIIPIADRKVVVIATEVAENPGTSVTHVAEHLASFVCERFGLILTSLSGSSTTDTRLPSHPMRGNTILSSSSDGHRKELPRRRRS